MGARSRRGARGAVAGAVESGEVGGGSLRLLHDEPWPAGISCLWYSSTLYGLGLALDRLRLAMPCQSSRRQPPASLDRWATRLSPASFGDHLAPSAVAVGAGCAMWFLPVTASNEPSFLSL